MSNASQEAAIQSQISSAQLKEGYLEEAKKSRKYMTRLIIKL